MDVSDRVLCKKCKMHMDVNVENGLDKSGKAVTKVVYSCPSCGKVVKYNGANYDDWKGG